MVQPPRADRAKLKRTITGTRPSTYPTGDLMRNYINTFIASIFLLTSAVTSSAIACTWPTETDLNAVTKVYSGSGAAGTGTFINDHQFLTVAHIMPVNTTQMVAQTVEGHNLIVRSLDPFFDVAIFDVYPKGSNKLGHPPGVNALKLSPTELNHGDDLYAVGYARDNLHQTTSKGFALVTRGANLYMSVPILGGQSGGPVLHCVEGELQVVGIIRGYLGVTVDNEWRRFNNITSAVPTSFVNLSVDALASDY